MVSRLTQEEASVGVQGLKSDLLVPTSELQNRALNGDFVALEVLPKNQWIKNYKSNVPALIDEEDGPGGLAGLGLEVEETNLIK